MSIPLRGILPRNQRLQEHVLCAVAVHCKLRESGSIIASARRSRSRKSNHSIEEQRLCFIACTTCFAVPQTLSQVSAASASNFLEVFKADSKRLCVCPVSITSWLTLFESTQFVCYFSSLRPLFRHHVIYTVILFSMILLYRLCTSFGQCLWRRAYN